MFGRKKEKPKNVRYNLPKNFRAILVRNINGVPIKIDEKKIDKDSVTIRFFDGEKGKTFTIPENLKITYCDGKHNYLFCDFDSGLLTFNKDKFPISIGEIDDLISKNVIVGLFSRVRNAIETKSLISGAIFKYLLCIGFGVLAGYILKEMTTGQTAAKMVLSWLT